MQTSQWQNGSSVDVTKTVDTFIRYRAPEIHPAWDSKNADLVFHNSIAKRQPPSPARLQFSQNAANSTTRLQRMVVHFNRKSSAAKVTQKFSIQGKNTWVEVQTEAEEAWRAYDAKRSRNWFRSAAGSIGNKAPALQSWLEVVPNSEYTSTACGALKIMFAACAKSSEIQRLVREGLDSTTELVEETARWLKFVSDPDLNDKAEQLYIAILDATEAILNWLDSGTFKEAMKSLFMQDNYGQNIKDSFALVQSKAEAFTRMVLTLSQEATMRIEKDFREFKETTFSASIESIKQNQTVQTETLKAFLLSGAMQAAWYPQNIIFNLTSFVVERQSQLPNIKAEQVLNAINADPQTIANDLAESIAFADSGQSRAMQVVQDRQFQSWFTSADSGILVICDLAREDYSLDSGSAPNPLTTLSGKLVDNISTLGLGLPLYFFCNPHVQPSDPLSGPLGMMKTLNYQLLEQFQGLELPFVDSLLFHNIHGPTVNSQWELFQKTMENTRPMVIFCIIDGLSAFDNGLHGDDVADIARRFQELVDNLNGAGPEFRVGPILKVLVTVPQMGATSARWFDRVEPLAVPDWGQDMIDGLEDMGMTSSMQGMYNGVT